MSKVPETVDMFPESVKATDVVEIRFLLKLAKPANVVSELVPRVERLIASYELLLSDSFDKDPAKFKEYVADPAVVAPEPTEQLLGGGRKRAR